MFLYIIRRLLYAFPVLLGLTLIVFFILSLIPGDPATAILGSYATPENVEILNKQLGLDKSFRAIFDMATKHVSWDFGQSYSLNRPVIDEVLERFSATMILAGTSFVICSFLGF